MTKKKKDAKEIIEVVDLFNHDPIEIYEDPEKLKKIVDYLREIRKNNAEAEAVGKKVTKKVSKEGVDAPINPMKALLKDS